MPDDLVDRTFTTTAPDKVHSSTSPNTTPPTTRSRLCDQGCPLRPNRRLLHRLAHDGVPGGGSTPQRHRPTGSGRNPGPFGPRQLGGRQSSNPAAVRCHLSSSRHWRQRAPAAVRLGSPAPLVCVTRIAAPAVAAYKGCVTSSRRPTAPKCSRARLPTGFRSLADTPHAPRVCPIRCDEFMHPDADPRLYGYPTNRRLPRSPTRAGASATSSARAGRDPPGPRTGPGAGNDSRERSVRRSAAAACGWCSGPTAARASGPIPKWCSNTCRKRAWEQKRAAASGRSAVEIVERVVTVPTQQPPPLPRQLAWVNLLRVLARQLDGGAVHDRHLLAIAAAAQDVLRAAQRRSMGTHPPVNRWE